MLLPLLLLASVRDISHLLQEAHSLESTSGVDAVGLIEEELANGGFTPRNLGPGMFLQPQNVSANLFAQMISNTIFVGYHSTVLGKCDKSCREASYVWSSRKHTREDGCPQTFESAKEKSWSNGHGSDSKSSVGLNKRCLTLEEFEPIPYWEMNDGEHQCEDGERPMFTPSPEVMLLMKNFSQDAEVEGNITAVDLGKGPNKWCQVPLAKMPRNLDHVQGLSHNQRSSLKSTNPAEYWKYCVQPNVGYFNVLTCMDKDYKAFIGFTAINPHTCFPAHDHLHEHIYWQVGGIGKWKIWPSSGQEPIEDDGSKLLHDACRVLPNELVHEVSTEDGSAILMLHYWAKPRKKSAQPASLYDITGKLRSFKSNIYAGITQAKNGVQEGLGADKESEPGALSLEKEEKDDVGHPSKAAYYKPPLRFEGHKPAHDPTGHIHNKAEDKTPPPPENPKYAIHLQPKASSCMISGMLKYGSRQVKMNGYTFGTFNGKKEQCRYTNEIMGQYANDLQRDNSKKVLDKKSI